MPLSTFLRDHPPTALRGLQWLALNDTAVIQRRTATSDSGGGASYVWAAYGTVECRVDPINMGSGRLTGGRIDERSTHVITCPTDAVVTTNDRAFVSGRGTFEVTQLRDRSDALTTVFEAIQL